MRNAALTEAFYYMGIVEAWEQEFQELLKQNNISLKCIFNIEVIFGQFDSDIVFGQSNVTQLLKCSKLKVLNLMNAM